MKKFTVNPLFLIVFATILVSSCSSTNKIMREPNVRVNMVMDDFILSDQVSAEASSTQIIGIDWDRLFNVKTGTVQKGSNMMISFASVPVVGTVVIDQTANYALYQMMQDNPGYDVVYYPQYETMIERPLGFGIIYKKSTVKVTARLGKMKN